MTLPPPGSMHRLQHLCWTLNDISYPNAPLIIAFVSQAALSTCQRLPQVTKIGFMQKKCILGKHVQQAPTHRLTLKLQHTEGQAVKFSKSQHLL